MRDPEISVVIRTFNEEKYLPALLEALNHGLPDCSGVAMGLDRLLMIMCEKLSIDEVLAFPFSSA